MEIQLAQTAPGALVGRTFGQYRILSMIQKGGMGEIYLAELAPQGIKVVLKRLQEVHDSDERYVEMFRNEAAVMSELEHPNVVKVLGVPVIEGKQCLVMELVKGRNLQQLLRRQREVGRRLNPQIAIHIMRKVLLGLHEAHQARFPDGRSLELVHRDVKPGNVLVSFAGDVKITDFGIAKSAMQARLTTAGVVKGTVRYLSPEQIRSEPTTFSSDLFSCATVLVEILTDQPLYDRGPVAPTLMAILEDDRAPLMDLLPFRAPELCQVLERALSRKPQDRFDSALAMARALGAAARSLGPPVKDDDVGSLLRQLFLDECSSTGSPTGEDVTYLLTGEVNPVDRDSTPPRVSAPKPPPAPAAPRGAPSNAGTDSTPPRARGSQPLDARSFGLEAESLPDEAVRADARARGMLGGQVPLVFDAPVELEEASDVIEALDAGADELDAQFEAELAALELEELLPSESALPDPDESQQAILAVLRSSVGGAGQPVPAPVRDATPAAPAAVRDAPAAPAAVWDAAPAASAELPAPSDVAASNASMASAAVSAPGEETKPSREGSRLRTYVLAGCLGGVVLTCAVLLLTKTF